MDLNSDKINDLREKIIKGVKLAFEKLVKAKQKENGKLVFSENEKIVYVDAKDIKIN